MRILINLLPVLGCAGGMLLCMRMMGGRTAKRGEGQVPDTTDDVTSLREEVGRLRDELRLRDADQSLS